MQNGEWVFDAERVAKSLGITDTKNGIVYIRWNRVNDYLKSFATTGEIKKGDFIPEPAVYKLAFKASNEVAEKFQDWLAVDVLPQIRQTGGYIQENREEEFINKMFPCLSEDTKKAMVIELQKSVKTMKPKADYYDALVDAGQLTNIRNTAKELCIKETAFVDWLIDKKFLYREKSNRNRKGTLKPKAEYTGTYFKIKDKKNDTGWTGTQTFITVEGKEYFRQRLIKDGLIKNIA